MGNTFAKLKVEIAEMMTEDVGNVASIVLSKMKSEILCGIKKYANLSQNDLKMSVKLLKSGKFHIDISCDIDDVCFGINI